MTYPRIHRPLLRGLPEAGRIPRVGRAGPARLCPAAAGPDHPQPSAAPDQPVSLPPDRRIRRPQMARQLRRQPDQGPADLFQARGPGVRPYVWQRHLPATFARNSASRAWPGTSIRASTPATRRNSPQAETFDFIWAHPPYWRQKLYADDATRSVTIPDARGLPPPLRPVHPQLHRALKPGGKLAILMGDYNDREAGYVPLVYHTKRLAFAAGLAQHCTDIIRFSHGASSGKKVYRSSFIPGLHDVCMIFEKAN